MAWLNPVRPSVSFRTDFFWAQGLNLELEANR
jgi:hypothetical protein